MFKIIQEPKPAADASRNERKFSFRMQKLESRDKHNSAYMYV